MTKEHAGIDAAPRTSPLYTAGHTYRNFLTWYTILTLAITAVWTSALNILLPNQVQFIEFAQWFSGGDAAVNLQELADLSQAVDAGKTPTADEARLLDLYNGFDASRAQGLALISSLAVVLNMLVQPIVGVLSDRTRTKWGRRAPWIVFGTLLGATLLIVLRFAPTIALLALLFMAAQGALNAALGPLAATVADRVPESRRGRVSALGGFGNFMGGLLGAMGAGLAFAYLGLNFYFVIAALVIIAGLGFAFWARDASSVHMSVRRQSGKDIALGLTLALRSRNFRWVWVARILLTFGYTVSTAMSLYMLQSYVSPTLSQEQATQTAPLLSLASIPLTLVALLVAGRLSDKLGKRRAFVIVASLLMAASMLIPLFSPTLPALFIQAGLAGIAFGIYLPVDQALFIDVLPDQTSAGRDLGVANLANNIGQALGPAVAGIVVGLFGGYSGIWVVAFIFVLLAGLPILWLKNVR